MREIKFRGKRIDNGEWVYGFLISPNRIMVWDKDVCMRSESYEVLPETVGQFTGLCDKNGKEIYEGDIVKDYCKTSTRKKDIYEIIFCRGCFSAIYTRNHLPCLYEILTDAQEKGYLKVIDNIHENPNLLEADSG